MSDNLDQLSIAELQNQLVEIQRRIQEKEKLQWIETISDRLKGRDLDFVRKVLDLVEGRASAPSAAPVPVKSASRAEEKSKKEGAYLRNGKVFYGIQEIKFTKYDKNQILRISKEGKGLPPRVDAFPDEIRDALLALPVRSDVAPSLPETDAETTSPSLSEMDTVVDERCPPEAPISAPESVPDPAPASEIEPLTQVTEPATVFVEVPLDTDIDEPLPEPGPAVASPERDPPRARGGRKASASTDASPAPKPKRPKPEPLQASLF